MTDVDDVLRTDAPCLACGHAEAHDRGEYEDTHSRCTHETRKRRAGYDCGHKRWRKSCEDANVSVGACYTTTDHCYCSSEDREIATLRATIDRLTNELAEVRKDRDFLRRYIHLSEHSQGCNCAVALQEGKS